ncbi:MAG: phytoene desaturase family protein [Woeseiaceae bacterium]
MPITAQHIVIVGAGINGLVAANYLRRAGHEITVVETAQRVGGACVSAEAQVDDVQQPYALGASVLGLMQDYVFEETGLAGRLQTFVPTHPKLIFFPGDSEPTWIHRDPADLDAELANKWGEVGDVEAFRADEERVVSYLQSGYKAAKPPTLEEAVATLGQTLTDLWITGSAHDLLNHYLTAERSKLYMAMTVTESGPVSLFEPYSAFTLPLMDSGSIFGGYYGFVKGGIWQITEELGRINSELGVTTHLASHVHDVDVAGSSLAFAKDGGEHSLSFDQLLLATDPLTASRLVGNEAQTSSTEKLRFRGSSGKLNLMFRNPVRWKVGSDKSDSDAAFRFLFSVDSLDEFERATVSVMDDDPPYRPGYLQIYCEGGAMRQLQHVEPLDRLAVFFKNLSLSETGAQLPEIENQVKKSVLEHIANPEDCVWSRLLTPRDLQQLFRFPGGNLDHTMLAAGQTFFERNFSSDPETRFYNFGDLHNVYLCASGTYPCGSVTGTPGYMCSQQLLRNL